MVAPTFVEHPQNLTVAVGVNATSTAAVTNTSPVPILFTLRKGSVNLVNLPPPSVPRFRNFALTAHLDELISVERSRMDLSDGWMNGGVLTDANR